MELIESSETSAYINTLTPGTCPKEKKLQSKHGESLKSRIINSYFRCALAFTSYFQSAVHINSYFQSAVHITITFSVQYTLAVTFSMQYTAQVTSRLQYTL